MQDERAYRSATEPEDLARFFVELANAGDVDGLVRLYEPEAILAIGPDRVAIGTAAIREFYAVLLASRPTFQPGVQRPALRQGGWALTSSRLTNGLVTAEVARQQEDGTWLWMIDQPVIAQEGNG